MNKGLQIVLLGLLFLVSGAVGYILEDILLGKEDTSEVVVEQPVAEPEVQEPAVSTIPVIPADGIKGPERNAAGNFELSVLASVESAHQLKYFLYKDEACTQEAASNLSGAFADIPAVASKTYYVRVQNLATGDVSEVLPKRLCFIAFSGVSSSPDSKQAIDLCSAPWYIKVRFISGIRATRER